MVQHTAGCICILVLHADTGAVLTGSLTDHEDTDAALGQAGEDAAVHTYDAYHGESRHGDERRTLDAADALDATVVVLHLVLDDGAGGIGVECVLDKDRDVLDADRIDGGRINHLGSKVAELHRLNVCQLRYDVGRTDDARVGSHEAIHVGPYLQDTGIQCRSNDAGGVVAAAPAKVRHLTALRVGTDEARYDAYLGKLLPSLLDESVREFLDEAVLPCLEFRLDELAAVKPFGSFYQCSDNQATDALAIGDDGCLCLWTKVADEIDTLIDTAQLFEQFGHGSFQAFAFRAGWQDVRYHRFMSLGYLCKRLLVGDVAFNGHLTRPDELVGNAP